MIHKILKVLKWVVIVIVGLYVILVIIRMFHFEAVDRTNAQIEKIHNTKLSIDDVMGTNLPPDPGVEANKTVQGIDANNNGIRDDVELAIFKEYPNSAKTRAVLLQYALAMQMETNQKIVNTGTVTEVVREQDRADACLSDTLVPRKSPESSRTSAEVKKIDTYIAFLKKIQINTKEREQAENNFYKQLGSYSSLDKSCDIDYSLLPN